MSKQAPPEDDLLLLRLVTIRFESALPDWRTWGMTIGDTSVNALQVVEESEESLKLLVAGSLSLRYRPKVTADGLVVVPDALRKEVEEAIEIAANLIAVAQGCRRHIASTNPPVFFVALQPSGEEWLSRQAGVLRHSGQGTMGASSQIDLGEDKLNMLQDRLDGVALLVEAMASSHATGRFHEFIRLFERVFARPAKLLTQPVLDFLDPMFGYTEPEVGRWFEHFRDRVTHADARPEVLLESDVRPVIDRMEQAAADILFNKAVWRNSGSERRELWRPFTGTTSSTNDIFLTKGKGAKFTGRILDEFGAFPLDFSAGVQSPPSGWWPPESPSSTKAAGGSVEIRSPQDE